MINRFDAVVDLEQEKQRIDANLSAAMQHVINANIKDPHYRDNNGFRANCIQHAIDALLRAQRIAVSLEMIDNIKQKA